MSEPKFKRRRPVGGQTKESKDADKMFRKVASCKICQSPHCDEITADLLNGLSGEDVRRKYNQLEYFQDKPLNAPNIHAHKKHCNPDGMAFVDAQTMIDKTLPVPSGLPVLTGGKDKYRPLLPVPPPVPSENFSPEVKKLYMQKYNETFDKITTIETIYKQRLLNLGNLQVELERYKAVPDHEKTHGHFLRIQDLTTSIDEALHDLTQDFLKHLKLEKGPTKNINIIFINNVKSGLEKFIESFIDVIVSEVDDTALQIRLKEKLIEKLDTNVAPVLGEKEVIEGTYEVLHTESLSSQVATVIQEELIEEHEDSDDNDEDND